MSDAPERDGGAEVVPFPVDATTPPGTDDAPFPAEAALAAAANLPLGPVGRYQVSAGQGLAVLVDTVTGRSWQLSAGGSWDPLPYAGAAPDAPP